MWFFESDATPQELDDDELEIDSYSNDIESENDRNEVIAEENTIWNFNNLLDN